MIRRTRRVIIKSKVTMKAFIFLSLFITLLGVNILSAQRNFDALYEQSNIAKRIKKEPLLPKNIPYTLTITKQSQNTFTEDTPLWRVYFQGSIIKDNNGIFQIIAPDIMEQLSIVVALIEKPKESTVTSLIVSPGNTFAIYSIKKQKISPHSFTWNIEKIEGTNGLSILPFSLIILMDPSIIAQVQTTQWDDRDTCYPLPTFILKNKNIACESEKSMLNALDLDPFHGKIREKEQTTIHEKSTTATTVDVKK